MGRNPTYCISLYIHQYSRVMAWWWPEFRVEIRCQSIQLFANCVLVVTEYLDRYYIWEQSTRYGPSDVG